MSWACCLQANVQFVFKLSQDFHILRFIIHFLSQTTPFRTPLGSATHSNLSRLGIEKKNEAKTAAEEGKSSSTARKQPVRDLLSIKGNFISEKARISETLLSHLSSFQSTVLKRTQSSGSLSCPSPSKTTSKPSQVLRGRQPQVKSSS